MHVLPTQQQQPHVVTKTPSPIRCPLFLDSNARRKPPGGKLKETSLTPMDHTHTTRGRMSSCLAYRLPGDFLGDDVQGERARAKATVLCQGPQRECANNLYQK